MQAFMMFVLVCVLNFRPAHLVAHYYVGRYTIINVNINVCMYLIFFFPSDIANTVNVVIFAGGKFRENVGKTFHVGVIFTILLIFPS